ncbi:hypothetical protein RFI_00502 [Reticulomyxa filosa]|uniref:Uncharacterized protein n=1 Tax=Reticulomyxa filosa TaxID=46433 RepID=X6PEM6_RETFI|nr:hypothetical protein RFI_00502 [Reticulomyxa filosa]|eukprot:ETO36558.1 hypothetical protein RFI_00502 [Reticulomyxa filosa]
MKIKVMLKIFLHFFCHYYFVQDYFMFVFVDKNLKHDEQHVRKSCVDLLAVTSMEWSQTQLDYFIKYLIKNGSTDDKEVFCSYEQAIQKLVQLQLTSDEKPDGVFGHLKEMLDSEFFLHSYTKFIGEITIKLDETQLECLIKKLNDKNKDSSVRISCAKSLGAIAINLKKGQANVSQLKDIINVLMNSMDDEEEVWSNHCAYMFQELLLQLKKDTEEQIRMLQQFNCFF